MKLIGKRNVKDVFLPSKDVMTFDFSYSVMVFNTSQMINNQ